MIKALIFRIHKKFPTSRIINIGIKPSFERQKDLKTIKQINCMMRELSNTIPYLSQIDLFNELMSDEKIDKKYFLQDGLHLNNHGYNCILYHIFHSQLRQPYYKNY